MAACLDPPPPLSSCKHIATVNPLGGSPTNVFSRFNLNEKSNFILCPDHSPESLSEALGFESFDDVEDVSHQWEERRENVIKHAKTKIPCEHRRSRVSKKEIPPPISSIGRRVSFKSYRCNGRLVLKEERILTQDILHACREDGRLKLQFILSDDDTETEWENETNSDNGNDSDDDIR